MKTIKTIAGVDCKIGRNSRTGSTVSLIVDDMDIIDVVQYFNDVKANKPPSGNIKRIELNLVYEDDINQEINLPDTKELDEAINNSSQPTLESIIIEQDEEVRSCGYCLHRSVGAEKPCNLECSRNPKSDSKIDLFEVVPRSMRL